VKTYKYMGFIGVAVAALFAGQAFALSCPTSPALGKATHGTHVCVAEEGWDGSSLQDALDSMTPNPGDIDVYNDQHSPSSYWRIGVSGGAVTRLVMEIADNAAFNSFGIFDPTNSENKLEIFGAGDNAGARTTLWDNGSGQFEVDGVTAQFGAGKLFGFYLDAGERGLFFSDPSLNWDEDAAGTYPNGMPHMVAFEGNGTYLKNDSLGIEGTFMANEFLLAWEDTPWANSDLDYNDFLVFIESVEPVPEPAIVGMFAFGVLLIGMGAGVRRRRSSWA